MTLDHSSGHVSRYSKQSSRTARSFDVQALKEPSQLDLKLQDQEMQFTLSRGRVDLESSD